MKSLDLTVLFHEGPISRAYLEIIKNQGYKVNQIIHILPIAGLATRFIPGKWRVGISKLGLFHSAHYWPNELHKKFPKLCAKIEKSITHAYELPEDFLTTIRRQVPIESYCNSLKIIEVDGLTDPKLHAVIQAVQNPYLLFTGGGIVPASLLELENTLFLHMHPGFLPDVRGADGFLWSMLLYGKPGASGFIMKPGIDEGDLIKAQVFPEVHLNREGLEDEVRPSDKMLYRMIFSFIDPALRTAMLRSILTDYPELKGVKSTVQDLEKGRTYHFMENRTKHISLKRVFGP